MLPICIKLQLAEMLSNLDSIFSSYLLVISVIHYELQNILQIFSIFEL